MSTVTKYAFFTEREAWNIFRLAAFGEAFGWTLLGTGVVWRALKLPNYANVLTVLGQIHGTFFLLYFGAVLATFVSLGWNRRLSLIALAASVPPYGTLVFEKVMAWQRQLVLSKSYRQLSVRALIIHDGKLLAVQASDNNFWSLPGGKVEAGETVELALQRHLLHTLGIKAKLRNLLYMYEYQHHGSERLELFFLVEPSTADLIALSQPKSLAQSGLDDLDFINVRQAEELQPAFLRTIDVKKTSTKPVVVRIITA